MPIDPEYLEFMPHTIIVRHTDPAPVNMYGERQYGAGDTETHRGRVLFRTKQVLNNDSVIVLAKTTIWLYGSPGLVMSDKIDLGDGLIRHILNINSFPDEDGAYYDQIYTT